MASDRGSSWLLIVQAATAALLTFALSHPANAQFWGNSWGWRQPQQPYYGGGFGRDPQSDYWGYRQRERAPAPRLWERPREVETEQPPDYSHAPPATPRKEVTVKVVVMGDGNADWLAYGLEEAFSEKPEIGIVRKHRTDSGLIRYEQRRDSEWRQAEDKYKKAVADSTQRRDTELRQAHEKFQRLRAEIRCVVAAAL